MNNIAIFFIILLITLSIGAIACGIYVAVQRSKPEYKRDPARAPSVIPIVSFIMVLSLVTGLLIFTVYYAVTKVTPIPPDYINRANCPKSFLTEAEFLAVDNAERTLSNFRDKVRSLPKIQVDAECPGGVCKNPFNGDTLSALSGSPQNVAERKKADRTLDAAKMKMDEAKAQRDAIFGEAKVGGSTGKNPWKK